MMIAIIKGKWKRLRVLIVNKTWNVYNVSSTCSTSKAIFKLIEHLIATIFIWLCICLIT